jgi:uncharacterized membrane protein
MNLTFFQGFVTGALVAMLIIFLLMAWTLGRMKNENKSAREASDAFNERSLALMKERNTQDLITHQYLKIIGLHLGEMVRIYNSR